MTEEKVFVEGMLIKLPEDSAPDFVKLKLSFKLDEFGAWVGSQKADDESLEWINVEIKESKSGKWYAERNMWKPDEKQPARQPAQESGKKIPW